MNDSGLTLKKTESSILKTDSLGKVVKATNLQDVEYAPIVHTHTVSQITDFPTFKTIENQSIIGAGNIDLDKASVGLGNVDNTSDLNKSISTATQTALNDLQLNKESTANKSTSVVVDYLSDIKFPSVKAVYDFCMSAFKKKFLSFGDVSGIAHTFGVGSENTMYKFSNNNPITATIPTNATTPFEIGTVFETIAIGNGVLTVTGAPGVTILSNLSNTSVKMR